MSGSDWTAAVELAAQAEVRRGQRRLMMLIGGAFAVGAAALASAVALRGVSWDELQARLEPIEHAQQQGRAEQLALEQRIAALEAEAQRLDAAVRAAAEPDPAIAELARRMDGLGREVRAARVQRRDLEARMATLERWVADAATAAAQAPPPPSVSATSAPAR